MTRFLNWWREWRWRNVAKGLLLTLVLVLVLVLCWLGWRGQSRQNARMDDEGMLEEKPVIYLYPKKPQDIHVEVDHVDFTTVYPAYDGGWHVRAEKDGTLRMYQRDGKTLEKGREYYALYYEGKSDLKEDWQSGFTVEKRGYQEFLEEKLRILGLSDREAEEFILYWLPRMERYPSVDVHFVEQSLLDEKVPLRISPQPDTTIRVFMQWRQHEDGKNIPREQVLRTVVRKGYVGVEWGGSEVARNSRIDACTANERCP